MNASPTKNTAHRATISIVIPSYNRGEVLLDTLDQLLKQSERVEQIIVVDQTDYDDDDSVLLELTKRDQKSAIRFIRRDQPSIPAAMNLGLNIAKTQYVLFLDDDIKVGTDFISLHRGVLKSKNPLAHVGQILQPGQLPEDVEYTNNQQPHFLRDLDFPFNSNKESEIYNCMAGNLCVDRVKAIEAGGFDENFYGAAYRFETEFCRRLVRKFGKPFLFAPTAYLHHLQYKTGGTRAIANHLTSMSPDHSVGDYYFALTGATGIVRLNYIVRRFVFSIISKFYLKHPWHIPNRLIGELRGILSAIALKRLGPKLIDKEQSEGSLTEAGNEGLF